MFIDQSKTSEQSWERAKQRQFEPKSIQICPVVSDKMIFSLYMYIVLEKLTLPPSGHVF